MTHRARPGRSRAWVVFAVVWLVAACTGGPQTITPETTKLTVGLGYIPSVQFAQFYLAEEAGYYREAGVEVEFQNKIDPELVTLLGQGAVDVGMADGTSVIPAVSQGIPIKYVATVYGRFPNVVFAKASSGIRGPADLRGKRLGIPGKFGSSWVMLQALLQSAGLRVEDLDVRLYPDFGQGAALRTGAVDAATGFANNEPVQLELSGERATVLRVDQVTPLPGPGLTVGTRTLETKRDAVRGFVRATLRAMRDIIADPQRGLDASVRRVPELAADLQTQRAILDATVAGWHRPGAGADQLGTIDRAAWARSIEFMRTLPERPVASPVTVDQLVAEGLL